MMMEPSPSFSQGRLWRRVLHTLVNEHGLLAAVLTDFQGLPFVAALQEAWARDMDAQSRQYLVSILAAFAPPLLRMGRQLENYIGDFHTDEITMRTKQGARIVARPVHHRGEAHLILTVLVPARRAYRRAMNRAIQQLRKS